jgi:glutathione S-transferase
LIALGCLTAHGDLETGKLKREAWEADRIIRRLQSLLPDFYPLAATRTEGRIELRREEFTKEELMKLYWKCGYVLHRGTFETLWSRGPGDADIEEIRTWKQKIEALLSDHAIFMADGNTIALFRLWEEQMTLEKP